MSSIHLSILIMSVFTGSLFDLECFFVNISSWSVVVSEAIQTHTETVMENLSVAKMRTNTFFILEDYIRV